MLMWCTLILSYGFFATHYSYHIDQLVPEYYSGTALISAGRWIAPLIHLLTNWMNFAPFWHTAIMAALLFFAATAWIILFKEVSVDRLSSASLLAFGVFFVSFPVLAAQLTYPVLNIALAYWLIPVALWILIGKYDEGVIWKRCLVSLLFLVPAIDMYESFAAVFLVGLFAVLILRYFYDESFPGKLKDVLLFTIKAVIILLVAIIVDLLISKLVCFVCCGTTKFWYSNNMRILWSENKFGFLDNAIWLLRTLFAKYIIGAVSTPFLLLYFVVSIFGCIVSVGYSLKRKTIIPFFLFAGLFVASLSLSIVVGYALAFTQEQALPIYVAFIVMLIVAVLPKNKSVQMIVAVVLAIIVLNQTQNVNNYAVVNYERYSYESELLEDVGEDLLKHEINNKPVVFKAENYQLPQVFANSQSTQNPIEKRFQNICFHFLDVVLPKQYYSKMDDWYSDKIGNAESIGRVIAKSQTAYCSFISWACPTVDSKAPYHPSIYEAMRRLGYNLILCSNEDIQQAEKILVENNDSKRYVIIETDAIIIVQFF